MVDPIEDAGRVEIGLVFNVVGRRIVMIMPALAMIREAMRVFHAQGQTRIIGVEDGQADHWGLHLIEAQPLVRVLHVQRRLAEIRHDVHGRLAPLDEEDAAHADLTLPIPGSERLLDGGEEVGLPYAPLGDDLDDIARAAVAAEQIGHEGAVGGVGGDLVADALPSGLVDLGEMGQVDQLAGLVAQVRHQLGIDAQDVEGAGASAEHEASRGRHLHQRHQVEQRILPVELGRRMEVGRAAHVGDALVAAEASGREVEGRRAQVGTRGDDGGYILEVGFEAGVEDGG